VQKRGDITINVLIPKYDESLRRRSSEEVINEVIEGEAKEITEGQGNNPI
jgi:hypothetical protein